LRFWHWQNMPASPAASAGAAALPAPVKWWEQAMDNNDGRGVLPRQPRLATYLSNTTKKTKKKQ
jgi:hypothetical protein